MSAAFETAVDDSKKLTSKPSNDELLSLYGLFKVAKGEDIEKAEKPGMFDLKGKAKMRAWEDVIKQGLTAEEAQAKYVELVESLKVSRGYDATKTAEAVGGA